MDINVLKQIGNVRCKKCNGWCHLSIYTGEFVCEDCGTRYIFRERED